MWDFEKVQELSITQLEKFKMDNITKLLMARLYDIKRWYVDIYLGLVKQPSPLTLTESAKVGWETAVRIAHLRERRYSEAFTPCQSHRTGPSSLYRVAGSVTRVCNHSTKNAPVADELLRVWISEEFSLQ